MPLMPWQEYVIKDGCRIKPDGTWQSKTNCLLIARQNGKTTLLKFTASVKSDVVASKIASGSVLLNPVGTNMLAYALSVIEFSTSFFRRFSLTRIGTYGRHSHHRHRVGHQFLAREETFARWRHLGPLS